MLRFILDSKKIADPPLIKIVKLSKLNGFKRILALQELLQILAKTKDYRLLAGEMYQLDNHDFKNKQPLKRTLNLPSALTPGPFRDNWPFYKPASPC